MYRFILLFGLSLIFFSMNAQQSPEIKLDWFKFKSDNGKFVVTVPGELREKIDSSNTPLGPLVMHTFYFQPSANSGQSNFMYLSLIHI